MDDNIEVGATVYFIGHCLCNGVIYETTVTEVLDNDRWGRQRFRLQGYDGIAISSEVIADKVEAMEEAEHLKAEKIKQLEMDLKLLRKRGFVINRSASALINQTDC